MLNFCFFLHFYQPPTQFPAITKKIYRESYEKILQILEIHKTARLTINFSASLTEQLVKLGLEKIVKGFAKLAEEGRVELVGSAAYHPLLPKIPEKEIERQISLNEQINKKYFGNCYQPQGFFPPEMAYSPKVGEIVEKMGYKWIILDESALNSSKLEKPASDKIYKKKDSRLVIFTRNSELSLAIAFAKISSVSQFFQFFDRSVDRYIIVAMDGETFGHHRPEQLKFLAEILEAPIRLATISELFKLFPLNGEIEPGVSTWGNDWERWDNPQNPIHRLQWQLFNLAIKVGEQATEEVHVFLDRAIHSDQFWWASHNPCWHPKMVERGAKMLQDVVLKSSTSELEKNQAVSLYKEIILNGRQLYGEEIVPC